MAICAEMVQELTTRLASVDAALRELLASQETLQDDVTLVESIIGIGWDTATLVLGELGTQHTQGRQAVAAVGLSVVHGDSGTSVHHRPRISKQGNAQVRKALYFPAMSARQHDPQLRAFAERLKAHGKKPKQILIAIMRKLVERIVAVLRTRRPYDLHYQWAAG